MYEDSPMDILSTDTCILLCTDIHGYMIFLYLNEFLIFIPFVFLHIRTLFTIFKISQYVLIEILKFEVNITSLY